MCLLWFACYCNVCINYVNFLLNEEEEDDDDDDDDKEMSIVNAAEFNFDILPSICTAGCTVLL